MTTTQDAIREAVLTLVKARQDAAQAAETVNMAHEHWAKKNAPLIIQAKELTDLRDIAEEARYGARTGQEVV